MEMPALGPNLLDPGPSIVGLDSAAKFVPNGADIYPGILTQEIPLNNNILDDFSSPRNLPAFEGLMNNGSQHGAAAPPPITPYQREDYRQFMSICVRC